MLTISESSPAVNEDTKRITATTAEITLVDTSIEQTDQSIQVVLHEPGARDPHLLATTDLTTIREEIEETEVCLANPLKETVAEELPVILAVTRMMVESSNDKTDDLLITNQTNQSSPAPTPDSTSSSSCQSESNNGNSGNLNGTGPAEDSESPVAMFSSVSDEIYMLMKKQLDPTHVDSNSNDANPRKDSPGRFIILAGRTNIYLAMKELS